MQLHLTDNRFNTDPHWTERIKSIFACPPKELVDMFDQNGYLTDEGGLDELEFYIVLVKPSDDNVPALTPRLALKRPGDRIYLGPKVAGRYTLNAVDDPNDTVVFLSTGTGEAPHNAMVVSSSR